MCSNAVNITVEDKLVASLEATQEPSAQNVVGWELTESTNACGEPRSSAKQENELTSPKKV